MLNKNEVISWSDLKFKKYILAASFSNEYQRGPRHYVRLIISYAASLLFHCQAFVELCHAVYFYDYIVGTE